MQVGGKASRASWYWSAVEGIINHVLFESARGVVPSWSQRAQTLMNHFLDEKIDVEQFCSAYEQMWNFDEDRVALSERTKLIREIAGRDARGRADQEADERSRVDKDRQRCFTAVHAARLALHER